MRVNANIIALRSLRNLGRHNLAIAKGLLRLSSGKRINRVSDDAAGFSMARGLQARHTGLSQALQNVGMAGNVLSTAEGGYQAISQLLMLMTEKIVQAADDANNVSQRLAIQGQIDALVEEIDAITTETTFQGTGLIDGSFTGKVFQTGAASGDILRVSLGSATSTDLFGSGGDITISSGFNDRLEFSEDGTDLVATIPPGTYTQAALAAALDAAMDAASVTSGLTYTVTFDAVAEEFTIAKSPKPVTVVLKWTSGVSSDLAPLLGFNTNADDTLNGKASTTSDFAATIRALSVLNSADATDAMTLIQTAINTLNQITQRVGEFMIRLESKKDTLASAISNTESARSRIEDADYAVEMSNLVKFQIFQQSGISALALANAAPEIVLSLF